MPTPLPTAESWHPANTANVAAVQLQDTAQSVADFAIFRAIVCGPWLLFILLGAGVSWGWVWRRGRVVRVTAVPPSDEEE